MTTGFTQAVVLSSVGTPRTAQHTLQSKQPHLRPSATAIVGERAGDESCCDAFDCLMSQAVHSGDQIKTTTSFAHAVTS